MSALTQDRVKTALQAALDDQPGKKDSKWTGSDEASWRENGYRSSPGRRHGLKTRRGARKKSVSPLRAFLSLRNAFGMRTDAEKDGDHN